MSTASTPPVEPLFSSGCYYRRKAVLIYQLTQTLYQLHLVESERDQWQRPDDVIECLKLKDGSVPPMSLKT